jgi:hypothetical protein
MSATSDGGAHGSSGGVEKTAVPGAAGSGHSEKRRSLRPAPWQAQVMAALVEVQHDLTRLKSSERRKADQAMTEQAERALLEAERFATARTFSFLHPVRWLAGGHIDSAFRHLHSGEVIISGLLPEEEIHARAPGLLVKYRKCLVDKSDLRLERLAEIAARDRPMIIEHADPIDGEPQPGTVGASAPSDLPVPTRAGAGSEAERQWKEDAAVFAAALRNSYDIIDQKHSALRNLRNGLLLGTLVLTVIVLALCVVGWQAPGAVPLCFHPPENATTPEPDVFCPSTGGDVGTQPASGDIALVALIGLLGAALSSAISVSRLPATRQAHTIAYALAFFKLPLGALTAIGGVLLIHGRFVPGLVHLDSQPQILAYAFVFGFGQLIVTRMLDRQAGQILNRIPPKETPSHSDDASDAAAQGRSSST